MSDEAVEVSVAKAVVSELAAATLSQTISPVRSWADWVQPLETEFGRKRRIDQSNCNKDFSCIEGFCPSFVTVHGGKLRKADRAAADPSALFADLPAPVAKKQTGKKKK